MLLIFNIFFVSIADQKGDFAIVVVFSLKK